MILVAIAAWAAVGLAVWQEARHVQRLLDRLNSEAHERRKAAA